MTDSFERDTFDPFEQIDDFISLGIDPMYFEPLMKLHEKMGVESQNICIRYDNKEILPEEYVDQQNALFNHYFKEIYDLIGQENYVKLFEEEFEGSVPYIDKETFLRLIPS